MRRPTALLIALLVLPLAGCLQTSDTVILKKDGSGSVSSTYTVELATFKELLLMGAQMGWGDPVELNERKLEDLPSVEHPAWAKEAAAKVEGYEITAATQAIEGKKRTTAIAAKFTSLQAAAKAGAFFIFNVKLSPVEKSTEVPNGAWKLELINTMTANPQVTALLPGLQTQLKSLSTKLCITLPTKILETNGKKSDDGKSVTWSVGYDDLIDAQKVNDMSVVFEAADDLKLKAFTHRADFDSLQKRVLQKPPTKEKDGAKKDGEGEAGTGPDEEGGKKPDEGKKDADGKKPEDGKSDK